MSSVTIILIILIVNIYQTLQCDSINAIDLQSATYSHSLILRVQPIYSSTDIVQNFVTRKVRVREIFKSPMNSSTKINEIILIRTNNDLDDSCWHLLRIKNIHLILFLNETNTNEFELRYPPVESTVRVRENINAVLDYETYAPQVIIKTSIDKPILSKDYSLQCNTRGNPLPNLLWSKYNQRLEYYPSVKQCKTPCRIYSTQNKYQSILYFQSLESMDSGIYICHAENRINQTMASVYIDVEQSKIMNQSDSGLTCAGLNFCQNRGQCIIVDNHLKCLCNDRYFGEQCETSYDDILNNQSNAISLFKSRSLTSFILILLIVIFVFIAFISYYLAKINKTRRKPICTSNQLIEEIIPKTPLIENRNNSELQQQQQPLSPRPITRIVTNSYPVPKASAINTDKDNISCGYHVPFDKDHTERFDSEAKSNHLLLSEGYLEFYRPDAESGLIRPLSIRNDISEHHMNYLSARSRFLLPRPIQQRW